MMKSFTDNVSAGFRHGQKAPAEFLSYSTDTICALRTFARKVWTRRSKGRLISEKALLPLLCWVVQKYVEKVLLFLV
jgi:hypothetical protein